MTYCNICKEQVTDPCQSTDEALADGCINPPKLKRGLDPQVAKRVAAQSEGVHSYTTSGSGSWS